MNGQPAAVHIICLVAKQIEKLCVKNTHNKVKGVVRIGDDNEKCGLSVAQCVKLHFVCFHKLPQFPNVKRGKTGAAGNEDRASCFSCR